MIEPSFSNIEGGSMMQLPSIKITSTHGQIGMKSQRPHIEIKQHEPGFSIRQEHVAIEINKQSDQLTINQREAFASSNLKHIYQLNKDFAAKGLSHASEMTAKYAREGDQLMRIENGFNVIPQLAKVNSILFPEKEITLAQMPKPFSVKTDYQPSKLSFHTKGGTAEINIEQRKPTIQHRPWQTDVYVRQKQNIQFQAVGFQVNTQL